MAAGLRCRQIGRRDRVGPVEHLVAVLQNRQRVGVDVRVDLLLVGHGRLRDTRGGRPVRVRNDVERLADVDVGHHVGTSAGRRVARLNLERLRSRLRVDQAEGREGQHVRERSVRPASGE